MKKVFGFLLVGLALVVLLSGNFSVKNECIRIHIRANSNIAGDQSVKYAVKDAVVEYLTPILGEETDFESAKAKVQENLSGIEQVAKKALLVRGYDYGVRAKLTREEFPSRYYGEYLLEEGMYDALILELGEGVGNNWWCVLFPPLCFTPTGKGENIEYRSKLAELCERIFN